MKPSPLCVALAAGLASTLTLPATLAGAPESSSLTIYSGGYESLSQHGDASAGYALVREQHRFELDDGVDTVRLADLPARLDVAGVDLQPLGDARVLGQRYDFALAGQDELLRRSIGRTITVEQVAGNTRELTTGTLLAAGDGLTLALRDGRVRVLSSYAGFELAALPDGLSAQPGLQWQVQSEGGPQAFQLDYPTAGLAWRAEYRVDLVGAADCSLRLAGHAQVANRSGKAFRDTGLTLVAGEPRRVRDAGVQPEMMVRSQMAMAPDQAPAEPVRSGEYHAYAIPGNTDLPDGSIQQVPLIAGAEAVPCQRRYEARVAQRWHGGASPVVQRQFGLSGQVPVTVNLGFENRREAGLGQPLPAGRVRVFDAGELLGEASIGHTAANEEIDLSLGTVFDLNAERRATDFELDRGGRQMRESFEFKLRNGGEQPARIEVHESLPRWSDWEIVEASAEYEKTHAQGVRFDIDVPAGGEVTLGYTVRYRWAPDIRVP
jgi:hypothetical protein